MENENTDDDVSVEPVPSTSHAPGMFYNPARSRCAPRAKRVPASRETRGFRGARGARAGALVARGSARGCGGRRAMTRATPGSQDTYKSYDDEDEGNPLDHFPPPPFTPKRPSGIQFQQLLLIHVQYIGKQNRSKIGKNVIMLLFTF